ncbi:Sodium channel protein Nach [Eumeta japonica]|uniref:Sodium channel protein Nach n=1 Tax=Eumeta variegata TaxID=151549 RepID=A0A4C1XPH7_EUMVA|nr:Sodium channel protein Nach [Eumeta japonica]
MALIQVNTVRSKRRYKTDYELMKKSLKAITVEYCRESSIGGLKYLADDETPFLESIFKEQTNLQTTKVRWALPPMNTSIPEDAPVCCRPLGVVWYIIVIGALMCSASLVWVTFQKYYSSPLVTTQLPEGIPVDNVVFPAVGICSINRISKKAVTVLATELLQEERNSKYPETEMLKILFALGQFYDLQPQSDDYLEELHQVLGRYDVRELLKRLTPRCEDLMLRCMWNEEIRNCTDLFDFRLTANGYCCCFNYIRHSDTDFTETISHEVFANRSFNTGNKSSFDFDQGLKVLLRFDDNDDFYYSLQVQGAQLQFSDAFDFPDAPSGSYALQIISPRVQMTVSVTASITEASREIKHIPLGLRKCLFSDESSYLAYYTYSDCLLKCRMEFLASVCNCTPFNMLKRRDVRVCKVRDIICLKKYYAQSITIRPHDGQVSPEMEVELAGGNIYCPMCYPTCSKVLYMYEFTNVKLYADYLNSVPDEDRDDWL